ncbi:hypothetical protein Pla52n_14570 [Stieleria varia]|uniref:Uncharacterized protein n=1 Tax=Stieleria varia TaxID=2528005 RepID=A0A5C6B2Q0_9BACT|nr:hypothetical protein Pla52n_14570 [Stieleria varia]
MSRFGVSHGFRDTIVANAKTANPKIKTGRCTSRESDCYQSIPGGKGSVYLSNSDADVNCLRIVFTSTIASSEIS